jgi:nicotinamidase-related amidase
MKINRDNTALLIIDLQVQLLPAINDSETLIHNCKILIEGCKTLNIPIITTTQYKKGLGNTVAEIATLLDDVIEVDKNEFSCWANKNFQSQVEKCNKRYIIIAGIESHICVEQTVLDLMDEDYKPIVIANCVGSRNTIDNEFAISRMRDYGADITTYESILFELLGTSKAAEFKVISSLVK